MKGHSLMKIIKKQVTEAYDDVKDMLGSEADKEKLIRRKAAVARMIEDAEKAIAKATEDGNESIVKQLQDNVDMLQSLIDGKEMPMGPLSGDEGGKEGEPDKDKRDGASKNDSSDEKVPPTHSKADSPKLDEPGKGPEGDPEEQEAQ